MKDNNIKNNAGIREKLIDDYWLKKISGMETGHKKINARDGNNFHSLNVEIDPSVTRRVSVIAGNYERAEFTVYLSFLGILLYKYYKAPERLVSSPGIKPASNDEADEGMEPFLFYKLHIEKNDSIKKVLQNTRKEFQDSIHYKDCDYKRLKLLL